CGSSKGWKPLPPGGGGDLPTVKLAGDLPRRGAESTTSNGIVALEESPDKVSKPLKLARTLATIIVAGAVLSALMVGAIHYFSDREPEPVVTTPAQKNPPPP